jgi:REP-associated tyrosine transposase
MARGLRLEFEDALYHLCARGNRREQIFVDERDRLRFLQLLGQSVGRFRGEVHAYVLLPNHFHVIARTLEPNLSRWMHWLLVSYSIYFNRRHRKSGHLFQGRYKSFLVEEGEHLLELSRYLHLNPVRGRVLGRGDPKERRERLRQYRWSSYRGYAALGKQAEFVSEQLVLGEFGGGLRGRKLGYRGFVEEGLLREVESPFEAVRWQTVLGSESFAQSLRDRLYSAQDRRREITGLRQVTRGTDADKLLRRVARHYRMPTTELLQQRAHGSEAHNVAMWLLRQRGETLREIGKRFGGIDYAAVSQRIRRLEKRSHGKTNLWRTCQMLNV